MSGIMAILGLIPGLSSLAQFVVGKVYDTKVNLTMARLGVDRDVAVKMIEAATLADQANLSRLGIIAQNKVLLALVVIFAVPVAFWFNKVVLFDNIFCPWWYGDACSTAAIKGEALDIMQKVVYFIFGAPLALGVGKMFFGRDKTGE